MKKILIVTYCFPPCNLTASQRVFSWAKDLHEFGWYPVFVCRGWDTEIKSDADLFRSTKEQQVVHEKTDTYEVFWLPYQSTFRDRLLINYGKERFQIIRKLLSYLYTYLEKLTTTFNPLHAFERFVLEYLKNNSVAGMYITANPYVLFKAGFLASKKYGTRWGADYRDNWSVGEMNYPPGFLWQIQKRFDTYVERKWLRTASFFTSISPQYVKQIGDFLQIPGFPLFNGFNREDFEPFQGLPHFEKFTVTYLGTLYAEQQIENFISGVLQFIESQPEPPAFEMKFPGIAYVKSQFERVAGLIKGYEGYFALTNRKPRTEVLEIEKRSHFLLQVGYTTQEGVVGSKVYEYMASGNPIIICPSDNGILKQTMEQTGAGVTLNTPEEVCRFLSENYNLWKKGGKTAFEPKQEKVDFYSRKNQTQALATCFDKFFN